MEIGFKFTDGVAVDMTVTQNGQQASGRSDVWGTAHDVVTAFAGRMNVFTDPDLVALPGVLDQGDGTYSLDLTDELDPDNVPAPSLLTGASGRVKGITFEPRKQAAGWGPGRFYYLALREDGRFDVRPGTNHRKIYTTQGSHGITAAQIATDEGVSPETVTGKWIMNNRPDLAQTPETAIEGRLGFGLWKELGLAAVSSGHTSNWLLLERGYSYDKTYATRLIHYEVSGESLRHPMLITAYGEGSAPEIGGGMNSYQRASYNVVIQDVILHGKAQALMGGNFILDHVTVIDVNDDGYNFQDVPGITFHRCYILDNHHHEPVPENTGTAWHYSLNRLSGAFISGVTGVLFDGCVFDMNGWAEGYDPVNGSITQPMPPSNRNHNLYLQDDNRDVTVRDNIFLRGSSFGMQLRPGGVTSRNAFIDNNAGFNCAGGDSYDAGPLGNYSLLMDNVVTSAGHKRAKDGEGALSYGIEEWAMGTSFVGNIVAHLADPDNPTEQAEKSKNQLSFLPHEPPYFDDTIVWNWHTTPQGESMNPNRNVDGLDSAEMNATTIQNLAAELLGVETATIADFAALVRDPESEITGGTVYDWFAEGFGKDTTKRTTPTTVTFRPDERGEGFRWDNPLNWSTGDLPIDGDTIDLNGNRVLFGAQDVTVASVTANGGSLEVNSGRLIVTTGDTDWIDVTGCGELA